LILKGQVEFAGDTHDQAGIAEVQFPGDALSPFKKRRIGK
jgi:hypothetical protein